LSGHALVMLPPQYDEPAFARRRFPVTLVLAGYPGHIGSLEGSLAVPQTVDSLLHSGRMTPMVMVLASPTLVPPRDTECTDIPRGPQVQTFLAQDLPEWVSLHFRVTGAAHWGVLGFSTGGFCAAKLALTHPQVFTAGVSLSGYLTAVTDPTTGDLFAGSTTIRNLNDPLWRVQHLAPPDVSLLLTASREETKVYREVEQLAAAARAPLAVFTIIRPVGGHNAGVWREELPLCLKWLSAVLLA
jgi:enterochelin esterase-like enzyme